MADDGENVLVRDDVLRVRHADVRLGLIVERDQGDLVAHLREVAPPLLDGELGAELDALTEGRLAAAERALGGDLDRALRSEEHTSELQSRLHLVCRLLLEKKKKNNIDVRLYRYT